MLVCRSGDPLAIRGSNIGRIHDPLWIIQITYYLVQYLPGWDIVQDLHGTDPIQETYTYTNVVYVIIWHAGHTAPTRQHDLRTVNSIIPGTYPKFMYVPSERSRSWWCGNQWALRGRVCVILSAVLEDDGHLLSASIRVVLRITSTCLLYTSPSPRD